MRAICLGEILIDFIALEPGPLQQATHFIRCTGGSATNLAVGLHAFGIDVDICSRVGKDLMGKVALNALRNYGISTKHIAIDSKKPTKCSFISHDDTGKRFIEIVNRDSADQNLTFEDIQSAVSTPFDLLHISGVMLLSDQGLAMVTVCIDWANKHGARISFDPVFDLERAHESVKKRIVEVLPRCDVIKLNDTEYRAVSHDMSFPRMASSMIIHTQGDKGALIKYGTCAVTIPAIEAPCIDPTGAGDAFFASFLALLMNEFSDDLPTDGASIQRLGEAGAAHASRIIQHVGGITYYKTVT